MATTRLTPRQQQALDFVVGYIEAHEYPPSRRELAEALDVTKSRADQLLRRLKDKGHISWTPGVTRGVTIQKGNSS